MDENLPSNQTRPPSGLRLTSRRQLVLEILQESGEHLDAEMVYTRARQKDPNISLATVYRTLALFKLLGLVEEHQFGQNHGHFEAAQGSPHYHFTCQQCGQVTEFNLPAVDELLAQVCQEAGQRLEQIKLEISGVCRACQAQPARPVETKPLSKVAAGVLGQVRQFTGGQDFVARAAAMGFTLGAEVSVIQNYGRGPILVGIRGTRVALGRGEAAKIQVSVP